MNENDFVVIDLGASGTRYCGSNGMLSVVPNNVLFLGMDEAPLVTTEGEEILDNLEVFITKDGQTEMDANGIFPVHAFIGEIAEKIGGTATRPQVSAHKHVQRINYVSAIVATAINIISSGADDIDVYLAVPPIEYEVAKDVFKERLTGSYVVRFPKYSGGTTVTFNVKNVICDQESRMACTSYLFNSSTLRPKQSTFALLKGTLVSLDIGASTVDISIVKEGKSLDYTGKTYKIGGNILRDKVSNALCMKFGFEIPMATVEKAITEGRLALGNSYIDISDILKKAKADFAQKITAQLDQYFVGVSIPMQTVNAILVSGGGSLASQYIDENGNVVTTSEPMSKFITDDIQARSFGLKVVEYGPEARFANVRGLYISARLAQEKRAKEAAMKAAEEVQTAQPMQTAQPVQPVQNIQPMNTNVQ